MNTNEILNVILSIPGATMVRQNNANFIAFKGENEVTKVAVSTALAKDTKNHTAFNFDAAVAEYKAYEAKVALRDEQKANKPVKVKGPNPEAQARRDELDAKIGALAPFAEYTATDILAALKGQVAENVTVMAVGSSAKRLVEKGVLVATTKDGDKKSYYTKA